MSDKDSSTNTANNARIMLVDDEPDINAALSVVLKREGYEVDTFENPFIALEKLKPVFYGCTEKSKRSIERQKYAS